eukprot:5729345-Amphidinium_carterae.1
MPREEVAPLDERALLPVTGNGRELSRWSPCRDLVALGADMDTQCKDKPARNLVVLSHKECARNMTR